ncbi:NAD(P)H-dependent oxidoreductase [Alkaliphilus sp. MSJ-5]|uniref:NAD(P)H-dependent oxidoreductase n=1 Tax=Alkaliphilus flagellatus TaxID=2841507 RepID=A0ABS6FYP7_9FIRM|nr:NAD(P)H-dependent oxidoreductase [Alkaliphilus flagellatus]MBU5675198.1 NAD(P)H-dependent oxidoreductase [Alkaliphilus flagellatus]
MKRKLLAMVMIATIVPGLVACSKVDAAKDTAKKPGATQINQTSENTDGKTAASVDGKTSASVVPDELVESYKPKGFIEGDKKKALFVVADPRKYSVNYDLANTAMKYFEDNGVEVELRDLYDMKFNPVVSPEEFYYAKDGTGEASAEIKKEQEFVSKSDYIIFVYPNWHDTPTAIVKGYMERVFAKQFAYRDTDAGLEGLLKNKSIYTIMNAGFLGGGRGYIGDGVGIDDKAWDEYMNAFKVLDDDTAGFWGLENKGRFVNDRTPKNNSENYKDELTKLRQDLINELNRVYFK